MLFENHQKLAETTLFPPLYFCCELKTISYLTTFSRCDPINLSTPIFGQRQSDRNNKKVTCCLEIQSKNGWNIDYLHSKPFEITYLTSIIHCGLVNPPTSILCNTGVTQTIAYWCSQKVPSYYGKINGNLKRVLSYFETKSDHFVDDLFVSLWICSLEHIKRGSNLPEVFVLMYIVREIWILQNIILWLNHALTAEKITGKVWVKPYFLFFLKFFKKVFILLQTLKLLVVENFNRI